MAFAALTTTAMTSRLRFGERYWPWALALIGGGAVAVGRVAAGRHFPSDVVVGALLGSTTGSLLPLAHARRSITVSALHVESGHGIMITANLQ